MEPKKPVQNELQSKTVIISEVEGIDDMLDGLNQGRGQLERPARRLDWKTAAIVIVILLILAELLWLLVR